MGQDYKVGETREEYVARRAIANQEAKLALKGKYIHVSVEHEFKEDGRMVTKTSQFESEGYKMVRQAMSKLRITKDEAMTLIKESMKDHVMEKVEQEIAAEKTKA